MGSAATWKGVLAMVVGVLAAWLMVGRRTGSQLQEGGSSTSVCNVYPFTLNIFCPEMSEISSAIYAASDFESFTLAVTNLDGGLWKVENSFSYEVQYGTLYTGVEFMGVDIEGEINFPLLCTYSATGMVIAISPTWNATCIGYPVMANAFWTYIYFVNYIGTTDPIDSCGSNDPKNCVIVGKYCPLVGVPTITTNNWGDFTC